MERFTSKILTQEEIDKNQLEYAEKFSEGDQDLKELLIWCWQNNLSTNGCCAGHQDAGYISFNFEANNFDLFIYFYECFKSKIGYDMYLSSKNHFEIYLKGTKEQTNFKEILMLLKNYKPKTNKSLKTILNGFSKNTKHCNYLKIYPYNKSLYITWSKNFDLTEYSSKNIVKSFELIDKI